MNRYAVFITPEGLAGIQALPAELRRRAKHAISALGDNPVPPGCRPLDPVELHLPLKPGQAIRCLRMEGGRIIYTVSETRQIVDVLAVRPRPPYDYDYIKRLMAKIK